MIEGAVCALPSGIELKPFRPVAYYDKYMDCIRVLTHDRSVTEHRIDNAFTVLECNHPSEFDPKYVGFTIKGVHALFADIGLDLDAAYRLADLIGRIVRARPGTAMAETLRLIFSTIQHAGDLEVDFRAAA